MRYKSFLKSLQNFGFIFGLVLGVQLAPAILGTQAIYAQAASFNPEPLSSVGGLPAQFLNQKLPRQYDVGYANWAYPSAVGAGDAQYEALLNEALAFYHVFHYVDATRAFHQAIQIQPNAILPRLGLAFSIIKLGNDQASVIESQKYFAQAQDLLNKGASQEEIFWVEFVGAYLENFLRGVDYKRDSSRSIQNIFADYANPNSDIEYLVLGTNMMSDLNALKMEQIQTNYKKALDINAKHAGAVHYLTHAAEAVNDKQGAVFYGELIAEYSKESAHAQHMYGHNLPIVGKWAQAEDQFEIADGIHHRWAKENNVPLTYDWHYSHNLFLWGYSQIASGMDSDRATDIMLKACQTNSQHCTSLFYAVASYGYIDKLKDMIQVMRQSGESQYADFMQESIYWLGLESGDAANLSANYSKPKAGFMYYINSMLEGKSIPDQELIRIKSTLLNNLSRAGFDSWSQVLPMSMLMRSIAVQTNNAKVQSMVDSVYRQINFKPQY